MSLYWLFKIQDDKAQQHLKQGTSELTINLQQQRAFKGQIGEEVVLMQNFELQQFTHTARISEIKLINPDQAITSSHYNYEVHFSSVKPLKAIYSLDDFAYSLTRVYKHYEKPYKHFSRKYSRLKKEDFQAIENGKIFLSRTAFGKLLNSLHPKHISIFLQYFSSDNPSQPYRNIDYVEALEQLNQYIDENILSHVEMLVDISHSLKILTPDHFNSIGFTSAGGKVDIISEQVSVIGKTGEYVNKNFSKELLYSVEKNMDYERGLRKYFKEYPIPLTHIKKQ